jgi:phosphinothricin acetyltransferase
MKIRLSHPSDAPQIAAIYAPFCGDSPVSFEVVPPSAAEMAGRIQKITSRFPWLVAEDDGLVAGYAYASPHRDRAAYRWAAEVTVYIHERFRRRGVGRALYSSLFAFLRLQGYCKAYGIITVPNAGSTGLHEAMGFELVGTFRNAGYKAGVWHDVSWWALTLRPPVNPPPEPRPFPEIAALPESLEAMKAGEEEFASTS